MTLRERVREAAASLAAEAGVAIEHVTKGRVRKEAIVARVLARRGDHPGLVHVISAMEACDAYKPWHEEQGTRPFCGRTAASASLLFYFKDLTWAWSTSGLPPGRRSACNSTATAIAGWLSN